LEEGADDDWNRSVAEHLLTRLDLVSLLPENMLGADQEFERRPSAIDFRSVPGDRVFSNIMVGQLAVTAVKLSMYRDLEGKVKEILGVLARDLAQ
jgi:hypothetical protein